MANNCTTLAGITLDCRDNVGGIETVFIENVDTSLAVSATAGVAAVADVLIDTVALDATLSSMDIYECVKQTGMLEETGTFSDENGTVFFTSVATAVFNKLDGAKLNELYELAVSAKLLVIVKDNNGKFWLVGNDRGAVATSSTEGTGTAYGDRNGISMSFTGIDNTPMVELTGVTV
tara:strand:- start:1863 stop:2393 length:531 start_codon:yes stop_codon:yes gene_type:complete